MRRRCRTPSSSSVLARLISPQWTLLTATPVCYETVTDMSPSGTSYSLYRSVTLRRWALKPDLFIVLLFCNYVAVVQICLAELEMSREDIFHCHTGQETTFVVQWNFNTIFYRNFAVTIMQKKLVFFSICVFCVNNANVGLSYGCDIWSDEQIHTGY